MPSGNDDPEDFDAFMIGDHPHSAHAQKNNPSPSPPPPMSSSDPHPLDIPNDNTTFTPSFPGTNDMSSFAPVTTDTLPPNNPPLNQNSGTGPMQQQPQQQAPPADQSLLGRCLSCVTVEGYRTYFDVTTADIQHRLMASLQYFNVPEGLKEKVLKGKTPDAYGPFWIATTLVFFVAVTSNMSAYLHAEEKGSFTYDVSHLFRAMILLYSYIFIIPLLYYFLFNCLAINMSFMNLFCLYGYSLVPYLPTALFCVIPDNAFVWFLLLGATGVSCIFVLRNVVGPIMAAGVRHQQVGGAVLCSVMGCHVIFLLILKLGFYHHVKNN